MNIGTKVSLPAALLMVWFQVLTGCQRSGRKYTPYYIDDICVRDNPFDVPVPDVARIRTRNAVSSLPMNNCTVVLQAYFGRVSLKVRHLDFPKSRNCADDRLTIYGWQNGSKSELAQLCGKIGNAAYYESETREMTFQLLTSPTRNKSYRFDVVATSFLAISKEQCLGGFTCTSTNYCISAELVCDEVINCQDASDEEKTLCTERCRNWCGYGMVSVAILLTIICGVFVGSLCALMFALCHRKQHKRNSVKQPPAVVEETESSGSPTVVMRKK